MNPDLELALELCDVADAITLKGFRSAKLVVDTKPDLTPVTDADRATERELGRRLAEARPDHEVVGEEFGAFGAAGSELRWLIDPIDGTKNYVRGVPVFATLIALTRASEPVVAVVSAPALRRRWWAVRGEGAFAAGQQIRVSAVSRVDDAFVAYDDVASFARIGRTDEFLDLTGKAWRVRGYSDFWPHALVAEGAVDAAVYAEPGLKPWDVTALQLLVEEAGGRFSALSGRAWSEGASALSSNGVLHEDVVAMLNP